MTAPTGGDDGAFRVQVGAFGDQANASRMVDRLGAAGFSPFIREQGGLSVVFAGASDDEMAAEAMAQNVQSQLGQDAIVTRR